MEQQLKLEFKTRSAKKAAQLRREGTIPAVIYNHGKTDHIEVDKKELVHLFSKGISESTLIELNSQGKKETVFIKDYQKHPVTSEIIHLDFFRITVGEKIRTHINIELVGKPAGVKAGGSLDVFLHEVEIELYPKDLSSSLKLDISNLGVNQVLHISDIPVPKDAKILMDASVAVCQVSEAIAETTTDATTPTK